MGETGVSQELERQEGARSTAQLSDLPVWIRSGLCSTLGTNRISFRVGSRVTLEPANQPWGGGSACSAGGRANRPHQVQLTEVPPRRIDERLEVFLRYELSLLPVDGVEVDRQRGEVLDLSLDLERVQRGERGQERGEVPCADASRSSARSKADIRVQVRRAHARGGPRFPSRGRRRRRPSFR